MGVQGRETWRGAFHQSMPLHHCAREHVARLPAGCPCSRTGEVHLTGFQGFWWSVTSFALFFSTSSPPVFNCFPLPWWKCLHLLSEKVDRPEFVFQMLNQESNNRMWETGYEFTRSDSDPWVLTAKVHQTSRQDARAFVTGTPVKVLSRLFSPPFSWGSCGFLISKPLSQ